MEQEKATFHRDLHQPISSRSIGRELTGVPRRVAVTPTWLACQLPVGAIIKGSMQRARKNLWS
jgi:hypothetical protein